MLSQFLVFRNGMQSSEHQVDHREVNHRLAAFSEFFIVLTESAVATEPPERALDGATREILSGPRYV